MRVLQLISPTGFYGAERWILALARHLKDFNVGCDLAVTSEDTSKRFELLDRFPIDNGQTHRVELKNRFDLRSVAALRKIIADRRIEIVHSHGYKSDVLGWLTTRNSKTLCISTPHGYGAGTNRKLRMLVRVGALALSRHDRVVPLSQQLVDETVALGISHDKITLIGNGVDLIEIDAAKTDTSTEINRKSLRIGYVGQLIPRKRIQELIAVFNMLWHNDRNRTLDIVGDGPDRNKLEALAGALPCASAVHFHGFIERRLELMRQLDLFVMTSEDEGIPRCLMEAQAIGVPVAAYDIKGVNDLIIHRETGMLAPLGDQKKLATYCESLLSERISTEMMVDNGRKRVRDCYSAQKMAEGYADLYHSLVSQT